MEVFRVIVDADMLEHSDRRDLVERTLQRAMVLEFERDLSLKPQPRDFLGRIDQLLLESVMPWTRTP